LYVLDERVDLLIEVRSGEDEGIALGQRLKARREVIVLRHSRAINQDRDDGQLGRARPASTSCRTQSPVSSSRREPDAWSWAATQYGPMITSMTRQPRIASSISRGHRWPGLMSVTSMNTLASPISANGKVLLV
jgi:hypothetical protein